MPPIHPHEAAELLRQAALPLNLQALAERGELRRFRKGTILVDEGDRGDTLFVLISGRVKAYSAAPNGREFTFGVYGAGDYIGEMSLDGGPRSASVITLEPTVCAIVTRRTLREHIAANPDFALDLISRVIRRARLATSNARGMALIDVYGRVVRLIDELAVSQPDGSRLIAERLTHAEIASRVGCSREMISKLMKDLVAGGHVRAGTGGSMVVGPKLPVRW